MAHKKLILTLETDLKTKNKTDEDIKMIRILGRYLRDPEAKLPKTQFNKDDLDDNEQKKDDQKPSGSNPSQSSKEPGSKEVAKKKGNDEKKGDDRRRKKKEDGSGTKKNGDVQGNRVGAQLVVVVQDSGVVHGSGVVGYGLQIYYFSSANIDGTDEYCERLGWKRLQDYNPTQRWWKNLNDLAEGKMVQEDTLLFEDELQDEDYFPSLLRD
ncbi:hypothetical protein AgCh_028944 [Apium graveolens]